MPLTADQRRATITNKSVFVEAGAGAGKTTVLVTRYLNILREHPEYTPKHILAITFTEKAAAEMLGRIQNQLAEDTDTVFRDRILDHLHQANISTIHGFCNTVLRTFPEIMHLDPQFSVMDRVDSDALFDIAVDITMFQGMQDDSLVFKRLLLRYGRRGLLNYLNELRKLDLEKLTVADLTDDVEIDQTARQVALDAKAISEDLLTVFSQCASTYGSLKNERGVLDFSDLLRLSHALITTNQPVRHALRKAYPFVMVDEFQDTDPLQWDIIKALAWDTGNLFVVGDLKQSIYAFRGAAPYLFNDVKSAFLESQKKGEMVTLTDNFRSKPGLLEWVNTVFEDTFESDFLPLTSVREETDHILEFATVDSHEPEFAAAWISRYLESHPTPLEHIAILFRRRYAMVRFQKALQDLRIPSVIHGNKGGEKNQDIIDLWNLAMGLRFPHLFLHWLAVLRSPMFCVSDDLIYRWVQSCKQGDVADRLRAFVETPSAQWEAANPRDIQQLTRAAELIPRWIELAGMLPLVPLLHDIYDDWGMWRFFAAEDTSGHRVGLIHTLFRTLENHSESPDSIATLQRLKQAWESDSTGANDVAIVPGAIQLLSIHAAKGLEFPVVVVPECGKGFNLTSNNGIIASPGKGFTVSLSSDEDDKITNPIKTMLVSHQKKSGVEEEKRILYVAATRARDALLFLGKSPKKSDDGPNSFFDCLFRQSECNREQTQITLRTGASYRLHTSHSDLGTPSQQTLAKAEATQAHLHPFRLKPQAHGILRMSVTDIRQYLTCPKHFHMANLIGQLPSLTQGNGLSVAGIPHAQVGQLVHLAIENHNRGTNISDSTHWTHDVSRMSWSPHQKGEVTQWIETQVRRFQNSDIHTRLGLASEASHETPFACRLGGIWLEGRFDTLFFSEGKWTILDYKTDFMDKRSIGEEVEKYRIQLSLYAFALHVKKRVPYESIETVLFFSQIGQECQVRPFPKNELLDMLKNMEVAIHNREFSAPAASTCRQCAYFQVNPSCPRQNLGISGYLRRSPWVMSENISSPDASM